MLHWGGMSPSNIPPAVELGRADIIEISGADAAAFAHAQLTSDVASLADGRWQWSAWLSAQGRARCVFVLLRVASDRLLLWLPLGGAAPIRDALARFVLRSKVVVRVLDGWSLADVSRSGSARDREIVADEGGYAFAQPGSRIARIAPAGAPHADANALESWRLADIAAGLPWIDPSLDDTFVPQALALERIDAIRFDKGCYPGQEIAARLHFRGGNKRHLKRLRWSGDAPVAGTRLALTHSESGVVLYAARAGAEIVEALAVTGESSSANAASTVDGPRIETVEFA